MLQSSVQYASTPLSMTKTARQYHPERRRRVNTLLFSNALIVSGRMSSLVLLYSFFVIGTLSSFSQKADIVFTNGKIWTVDKQKPTARAVAVLNGHILAAGSNADIQRYIEPAATKVIDLAGKFMMPGFIDNHANFMMGGFQLQSVNLRDVKNETEFAQAIKDYVATHPNRWVTGGYWNEEQFTTLELPGKELVDVFTEQQGVFLTRYDGTMGLANSVALFMAGITKATPNPPGGVIEHDKNDGEPTGILKGEAMKLVTKLIPEHGPEENLEAARLALAEARKYGITTLHDISDNASLRTYQILRTNNELTVRMYCRLPIGKYNHFSDVGIQVPFGDEYIRVGAVNTAVDGSLSTLTALFFDPYVSNPRTNGLATEIARDDRLETWALASDRAHLQLSIDATGDNAVNTTLDIYEKIARTNPRWERRFRLEHAQHIAEDDFARIYGFEVIAAVQPYHIIDDGRIAGKLIGVERCKSAFPLRTFLDKKITMCFGSDWPLEPLNPLLGIYAAVTRRTLEGAHPDGWFPEQKITIKEAIEAYTIKNAFAAFEENEKGSITAGKLADFVVLSGDLITIDPAHIEQIFVEMTVVGGKIVYQR